MLIAIASILLFAMFLIIGVRVRRARIERIQREAELDVARSLARNEGTEAVDLDTVDHDVALWDRIGRAAMAEHEVVPLEESEQGLVVAVANPTDHRRRVAFEEATGRKIARAVAAPASQVWEYAKGAVMDSSPSTVEVDDDPPIVKLVNRMIEDAYARGASTIRIEPSAGELVVRHRIDDRIEERMKLPMKSLDAIVSRIDVMANMKEAGRRARRGRIAFKPYSRTGLDLDLQVTICPSIAGETCVLVLLVKGSISLGLDAYGFSPRNLEIFQAGVAASHGVIAVSGPAGSGKTSTLYSAFAAVGDDCAKIVAGEDHYDLKGATVLSTQGATTLELLERALLLDPDAILVSEPRDAATARRIFEVADDGHLVLTWLRAGRASGVVRAFLDLGVEPELVARHLRVASAQRLCRRVCRECKVEVEPGVFRGKGCEKCQGTGLKGRVALHEVIGPSDDVRAAIRARATAAEIEAAARRAGLATLREDGAWKVREGVTTAREVEVALETDVFV